MAGALGPRSRMCAFAGKLEKQLAAAANGVTQFKIFHSSILQSIVPNLRCFLPPALYIPYWSFRGIKSLIHLVRLG